MRRMLSRDGGKHLDFRLVRLSCKVKKINDSVGLMLGVR